MSGTFQYLNSRPITLASLAPLPRFVMWRNEERNGKLTKVPYAPATGRQAKANDPRTWTDRAAAQAATARLVGDLGGGIGLELGDLGDGRAIGGIDLDSCRNPDGTLEPWALDVMTRFGTYTETSPSQTGCKLFFTYPADALPELRRAMQTDWGKQWKRGGSGHPPAIELHLGNRYFAVTDWHVRETPVELRPVSPEMLLQLIRQDGPAFAQSARKTTEKSTRTSGNDGSRSATAMRLGAEVKRSGGTFEKMVQALLDAPETAEWAREKGQANNQRELRRIWNRADPGPDHDTAADLAQLAKLSGVEFSRARRDAASRLGMTVRDVDRAVKNLRRRAFQDTETAERERQRAMPGAVVWPPGYRMEDAGLTYLGGGDDDLPVKVSGPFQVLGESRSSGGQAWGLWLAWQDRDGRRHEWPMQRRQLMTEPGVLEAELSDRGLRIGASAEARALLRIALAEVETNARVTSVSRTGWHAPGAGPAGYVLADGGTVGATAEPLVLLAQAEDAARRVASAGTLPGWQANVAALAAGNPSAVFCIASAFVGPLLEVAGEDGGGVHLFGPSKRGKTVAMRLAASVWGPPDKTGALRDWRTTGNALEAACEEAADGLLTLDEIQQAEPRDVVGAIYAMGNGGGKGRLRADASARRRRTWRTFFLSNGEVDVPTMAQKVAQRVPPGAEVRLPSVPLPAQLWPSLHGRADFQGLCADLATAVTQHHGTAVRAFLEHLTAWRDEGPHMLVNTIAEMRDAFMAEHVPPGADPQVREVARRMALIAAAGEIARDLSILPWTSGEATAAAAAMFELWRDRRGGNGSGEDAAYLAKVRLFIVQHGSSRMQPIRQNVTTGHMEEVNDPARTVVNRAGWRQRMADGTELYLFAVETWRAEVCEGLDAAESPGHCGVRGTSMPETERTSRTSGPSPVWAGRASTRCDRL